MMLDRHPVIISRLVAETLTCRLGSVDGRSSSKYLTIYGVEESHAFVEPLLDERGGKLGREARKKQELAPEFVFAELVEKR